MHIRWFGEPWGKGNKRAPICETDEYKIDVPVGTVCLSCKTSIKQKDRGVVTAASPEIEDSWELTTPEGVYPVVSYHAQCFFDNLFGSSIGFVLHEDEFEVEEKEPESIEPGRGWGKEQT